MAYKELVGAGGNGGTVLKWDKPGQVVEGRLVATKRGKVFNGRPTTLAIIKQKDGVDITIPLTTVLAVPATAGAGSAAQAVPSAAEIEAAKAMFAGLNKPQVPVNEYDRLLALLSASNPKGAAAIKGALESMYAEGTERLDALKSTLAQQGITADG